MDIGSRRIISLTTDFGTKDPFVGTMKGVILNICPDAVLVDITHQIEPYNIFEAALTLNVSYPFFPAGTIHLVVIDPGVGSSRRPIIAESEKYYFVAPDNGVLSLVYQEKGLKAVREVTVREFFLKQVSSSFHGRDIFAPVAAWLARGEDPSRFGPIIHAYSSLPLPKPLTIGDIQIRGEIIYIDRFGNLMSNIDRSLFQAIQDKNKGKNCQVFLGPKIIQGVNRYYSEAPERETGAIFNSWEYLEIYVNQGSASQQLGQGIGTEINIIFL